MLEVTRIKKTNQIVYTIDKVDSEHTLCLFPFKEKSKKGNLGVTQSVRNSNLVRDREII
jgi:hypothetical protein